MVTDELIRQLLANGTPVWVVATCLVIITISQLFPKFLGPISQAIFDFTAKRRQAAIDRDDADILERDRMIAHLSATGKRKDDRIEALETHCWAHRHWELEAMDSLPKDHPPPPSMFPPAN